MKFRNLALASLALALTASVPAQAKLKASKPKPAAAQAVALSALTADAKSSLKILGDSTMHKWTVNATKLELTASAPGSAWEAAQKGKLEGLKLSVIVDGLKSTESGSMDKNLYKAMESEKFPNISFAMTSYVIKAGEVSAKGDLSIHGVSKPVELKGKIAGTDKGVSVVGSFDLLMSDYGVKPPVMMLGTVKVVDKVSIAYDFALEPKP